MPRDERAHNNRSMDISGVLLATLMLTGCGDNGAYTLYRNSLAFSDMRIHVATFDAADGDKYNGDNCRIASELFAKQPGVTVRYWCEKGRFQS
jgi:hypothetical protein